MRTLLPTGVVTFLFTDVVGSTRLWETAPDAMGPAMVRHDSLVELAVESAGGQLVRPRGEGDSRFAVFGSAVDAVKAAAAVCLSLADESWQTPEAIRVRVAVHTGEADLRAGDYYGDSVNRCARLRSLAHPGQVLLSAATVAVLGRELPAGLTVLDLGTHRLKDLTRPEQVFQLTDQARPADFPALLSMNRAKHNLPIQLSSFVGRQQSIADLAQLVTSHQLVTITGFGGMGKTRLALQVAAEMAVGDGDGSWFVDLSAIRDTALIPEAIARVLGFSVGAEPLATLTAHLADKKILLVCDNLEQLLPHAAPAIAAIAAAGPDVRVLATSREAVGVRGEQVYPVQPLPSPAGRVASETLQSLAEYDAATLFIERATGADPAFAVDNSTAPEVAAICTALDGWPLALELAAARVRLLGLTGLARRLNDRLGTLTGGARDLPDRQRTLRETISWSHELLAPDEQDLLARLAVFQGSASLEAIETVCGSELDGSVLDTLGSLLDKSFVLKGEGDAESRYRLLEPMREFAVERLAAQRELRDLEHAHAHFFSELFSDSDEGPRGDAASTEIPNINKALETLTRDDPERAGSLLIAVYQRLFQVGHIEQGRIWTQRLRAMENLAAGTIASLDIITGIQDYYGVDRDKRFGLLAGSLQTLLELRQHQRMAVTGSLYLGALLLEKGDFGEAMTWAAQALEAATWTDPPVRLGEALEGATYIYRVGGREQQAVSFARRAIAHYEKTDPDRSGGAMSELCRALVADGQTDEALRAGRQCLELSRQRGSMTFAHALGSLGRALLTAGDARGAATQLVAGACLTRDIAVVAFDLGWAAVALRPDHPEIGASLLGATDELFTRVPDRDLYPPDELLAPARELYERVYSAEMAHGRELAWPAVATLLDPLDLEQTRE